MMHFMRHAKHARHAKLGNTPGAQSRYVALKVPGSDIGVELIEYKDIARKPLHGRVQDPGTAILQLRVRDVTALTARLKKAGVPVVTTGRVPVDVGTNLKIAIVRDPNNLMLELLQSTAQ